MFKLIPTRDLVVSAPMSELSFSISTDRIRLCRWPIAESVVNGCSFRLMLLDSDLHGRRSSITP
jgi:hypothetical protein